MGPRNATEQNVVAVYYVDRIAGQKPVTTDQVYTCYKDRNWRVPKNFRNALQKTAASPPDAPVGHGQETLGSPEPVGVGPLITVSAMCALTGR